MKKVRELFVMFVLSFLLPSVIFTAFIPQNDKVQKRLNLSRVLIESAVI
mgnify:CR=1 FL=1